MACSGTALLYLVNCPLTHTIIAVLNCHVLVSRCGHKTLITDHCHLSACSKYRRNETQLGANEGRFILLKSAMFLSFLDVTFEVRKCLSSCLAFPRGIYDVYMRLRTGSGPRTVGCVTLHLSSCSRVFTAGVYCTDFFFLGRFVWSIKSYPLFRQTL
jgi:hypothetical protein